MTDHCQNVRAFARPNSRFACGCGERVGGLWRKLPLRFSTRCLLIVVTVVCILLGHISAALRGERAVIERLRARVDSTPEIDGGVYLKYGYQNGAEPWTRHGIVLYKIASLIMCGRRIDDACVRELDSLDDLSFLSISGAPKLTDACVPVLGKLKRLGGMRLIETGVTSAGVAKLRATLPDCDIVWAPPGARGACLAWFDDYIFSPTHDQPCFMARGHAIDDKYLAKIPDIATLGRLYISDAPGVTDVGLQHLTRAKCLKHLILHATQASSRGVQDLQRALPGCIIERLPPGPMVRPGFPPGWWGTPV
jgi:hypothetical protein